MASVLLIVEQAFNALIYLLTLLLVVQAVLSWIPQLYHSRFGSVINTLTEPLLYPARKLLFRIERLRSLPVDLSPLVAYFFLLLLQMIVDRVLAILIYIL